jgi:hypothetical protein
MSTNRTKIDWAYRQAVKIQQTVADVVWFTPHDRNAKARADNVREIAAILRRAQRRGLRGYTS